MCIRDSNRDNAADSNGDSSRIFGVVDGAAVVVTLSDLLVLRLRGPCEQLEGQGFGRDATGRGQDLGNGLALKVLLIENIGEQKGNFGKGEFGKMIAQLIVWRTYLES